MHVRPISLVICGLALMAALALGTVLLSAGTHEGGAPPVTNYFPYRTG